MPFDLLSSIFIKNISNKALDKVFANLQGSELSQNLRKAASHWEKTLPEEIKIEPEVFFPKPGHNKSDQESFPYRVKLFQNLEAHEIPKKELWFNALQEHREDRRTALKDQAHIFFRSDNTVTDKHLENLADKFYHACILTESFFRKTVITALESINSNKDVIQGIDERDLADWLEKLESRTKTDRLSEVRKWYEDRRISANLREALSTVVERIDAELKASRETIERLRAENQSDLADLLERLNKAFEKGQSDFEREAADILNEIDKETAERKIKIYFEMANKYETVFQYAQAIDSYKLALELQENYFDADKKELSFTLNQLGEAYLSSAKYDSAIESFERTLKFNLKTLGPDHPSVARSWNNLGSAWHSKGQYEQAIAYFEKARALYLKTYGPDHPSVARSWHNLGVAWHSKGQYDQAIAYFEKARALYLETYGPDHPTVARNWNNLGSAWKSKGQYDPAIAYFKKALALFTKIIGKNHPHTKIVENNLKRVRNESK